MVWHRTATDGNPTEPGRYLCVELTRVTEGHRTGDYLAGYELRCWANGGWVQTKYDDGPIPDPYCWMDLSDLPLIPFPEGVK